MNIRMSIDIPEEEHKYLKMCCARLRVSIRDFVINAVIEKVDLHEDEWMLNKWEQDGTREEIEKENLDPNRTVWASQTVEGKSVFVPMMYSDFVSNRKSELSSGV